MKNFSSVLRELLVERKMSAAVLSRKAGISEAQISRWLSGKSNPSKVNMSIVASALGVPVGYFDEGSLSFKVEEPGIAYGDMPGWYQMVVHYESVSFKKGLLDFSAGTTEVISYSMKRLETLRAQAHSLFSLPMSGDAMYPEIRHGDRLLIDRSKQELSQTAPMLVAIGNALMVRFVNRVKNNVDLEAVNKNYESKHFKVAEVTIIGQVLEITRTML